MQTLTTIAELRSRLNSERTNGKRIALVPTMGNLHQGHLRLVETAVANADFVVASIFVNPLQFGPNEDLERYPRTLAEDQAQLEAFGCNLLFAPSEAEVYPQGRNGQTFVEVPGISDLYCGASRPGHFRGVTTIVNKLFNLIQPDVAIFGCKDYQQLHVIRRMVDDLSMPVELIGVSTERAANGLALSSRNGYLTEAELAIAPALYATLCDLRAALQAGDSDHARLIEHAQQHLERNGFLRDYIHILRRSDMLAANASDRELVIIAAAYLGAARLIDNIEVDL
ncbi:pantoate--beta-alanine ligase [Marinobacterium sp. D7]|uniref:pantoate--beta-alanine ligase n=1 Tax=Marinobacterium ramblicola TaxID=2849041 RepID=UPI001C2DE8E7|nr:pantoate--beta-alanine ligase [Marinobacterium ramblicola]MBV1788921.1 pantoate--beta-alanine ligase [Marinobacterium ramblicola]